jgi:hypothetical protein
LYPVVGVIENTQYAQEVRQILGRLLFFGVNGRLCSADFLGRSRLISSSIYAAQFLNLKSTKFRFSPLCGAE